mmetsp:Transcript_6052/g.17104  ORF Transcript_6052/g.17104 Transcript_6052/m.17104 type:complete len:256 (-) Transcript_6052:1446-2213(-)
MKRKGNDHMGGCGGRPVDSRLLGLLRFPNEFIRTGFLQPLYVKHHHVEVPLGLLQIKMGLDKRAGKRKETTELTVLLIADGNSNVTSCRNRVPPQLHDIVLNDATATDNQCARRVEIEEYVRQLRDEGVRYEVTRLNGKTVAAAIELTVCVQGEVEFLAEKLDLQLRAGGGGAVAGEENRNLRRWTNTTPKPTPYAVIIGALGQPLVRPDAAARAKPLRCARQSVTDLHGGGACGHQDIDPTWRSDVLDKTFEAE